jgi:integrase
MLHLHNHATRMGWLIDNNLMPKVDIETHRKSCGGNTVAITEEQHLKIIKAMEVDLVNWDSSNYRMKRRCRVMLTEVKTMLELLWELGSSNADTREFTTDNIDWNSGHIIFKRKKWKGNGVKGKRIRQPIRFPMSAKLKEIIRPLYDNAVKRGGGYLLPRIAQECSSNVLRVFKAYREAVGVPSVIVCEDGQARKIIIHSYRYRMAEHLFEIGATEAEAKALMGWQSREVMLAYAKGMKMKIPALDVMAKERGQDKIIPMEKVA